MEDTYLLQLSLLAFLITLRAIARAVLKAMKFESFLFLLYFFHAFLLFRMTSLHSGVHQGTLLFAFPDVLFMHNAAAFKTNDIKKVIMSSIPLKNSGISSKIARLAKRFQSAF